MRVLIQRSFDATVTIAGNIKGQISNGLVVLVGFEASDEGSDIDWVCKKMVNLRIFSDKEGVMNKSLLDTGGQILLVSQFTLHASTKKGNRPSYMKAARPEIATLLYEKSIDTLEKLLGKPIETGTFGADMKVSLTNDGPVTIIIDSKNRE